MAGLRRRACIIRTGTCAPASRPRCRPNSLRSATSEMRFMYQMKRYLLQAHDHHTGCRADDEHRAANAGAVGQQLPEDAVLRKVAHFGHRVHAHAAGNERNVVNDARHDADDAGDEVVVAVEAPRSGPRPPLPARRSPRGRQRPSVCRGRTLWCPCRCGAVC